MPIKKEDVGLTTPPAGAKVYKKDPGEYSKWGIVADGYLRVNYKGNQGGATPLVLVITSEGSSSSYDSLKSFYDMWDIIPPEALQK